MWDRLPGLSHIKKADREVNPTIDPCILLPRRVEYFYLSCRYTLHIDTFNKVLLLCVHSIGSPSDQLVNLLHRDGTFFNSARQGFSV